MLKIIIIIFVIIILILYVSFLNFKSNINNQFLKGFWNADIDFCKQSNIEDMIFFFDMENNTVKILIQKNNTNLENTTYNFDIKKTNDNKNFNIDNTNTIYNFIIIEKNNNENIMNGEYKLHLDIIKGMITLYKDDTIYAALYKDNISTSQLL